MRITTLALALVLLAGCSKSSPTPPDPADDGQPDDGDVDRPQLTTAACEAQGGKVVGDIGDGAIHRPDYVCPDSGEPPIGTIVAEPEGPMAIEGSVCCK